MPDPRRKTTTKRGKCEKCGTISWFLHVCRYCQVVKDNQKLADFCHSMQAEIEKLKRVSS